MSSSKQTWKLIREPSHPSWNTDVDISERNQGDGLEIIHLANTRFWKAVSCRTYRMAM